ncbi:TetR/AcrR family transcriptional regulator [Streptomyces xylophagus]|uniref:TetR/AcrR family transcriptional regulator n=1 Tax=Streptomyces xylophagus TaxID=285514 RepID=UPI0005BB5DB0|nr:TetR/AcrR family transcriptional regulator [Streptomyces xylophagus]
MANTARAKSGLREMTRRMVRTQIAETAMTLFVANGFEQTTVEQIAGAVGMSGRSVFRYFPTKEDMVVGHMDEIGDRLAEALAARPLDEDSWTALRHAMQPHLDELTADADTNIAVARMLDATPALRPSLLNKRARWADTLLPDITRRLRGPTRTRELRARAIVSSALACLNVAVDEWARTDGTKPIGELLDTALTAVRS